MREHEASTHLDGHIHHRHSHAAVSAHPHGHHLLQVEGLTVSFTMYDPSASNFFSARRITTSPLRDLTISVHTGEVIAVVGASGSGKTLLADAIMGLHQPNATVTGTIWFDGCRQDANSIASLRGNGISLVPQSVNYLDPLMKVGAQIIGFGKRVDTKEHKKAGDSRDVRKARMRDLFDRYGLDHSVEDLYPFELSGGMARRVLLICALMDCPQVIIADEPTPGLDLDLAIRAMDDFRAFADDGGGVMLITHDIELALRVADRVAVFHDGTIVEETSVESFASPDALRHPFTRALWHALPENDFDSMSRFEASC